MANTEILEKILGNDLCAKWINLRDYAFDKLSANPDIKEIMDEVDKYGYGEWVCEGQVPVMTSNTAPYGETIADSVYSGQNAWKAFDNDDTSYWSSSRNANGWCGYHFINPVIVKRVMFYPMSVTGTLRVKNYKIQGSNDGTTWTDLTDTLVADNEQKKQYVNIDNDTLYSYYRMFIIDSYGSDTLRLGSLQFYAYQPKGNVPIMTSNTAPYGEAFSGYSGSDQWKIFDEDISTFHNTNGSQQYAGYKFVNPIKVKKARTHFKSDQFSWITGYKLQASNDGSTWIDLTEDVISSLSAGFNDVYVTKNEGYYLYYREWWTCTSGPHREYLQFYGREMKVSVPAMTSNTQPWGEVSTNGSVPAWYAFDGRKSGYQWGSTQGANNVWLVYDFKKKTKINGFGVLGFYNNGSYPDIYIQGSNDGTEWDNIYDARNEVQSTTYMKIILFDNDIEYSKYRIFVPTQGSLNSIAMNLINFFGFDYSERDWDTEHPMKYLYDHGVELEEMTYYSSANQITKKSDSVTIKQNTSGATNAIHPTNKIPLGNYNLLRVLCGLEYFANNGDSNYGPTKEILAGTIGSYSVIAYSHLMYKELPYNGSHDISSITQENWPAIGHLSGDYWTVEVTEFWLE